MTRLLDEATDFLSLRRAAQHAARGHGRSPDAADFLCDLERHVIELRRDLRDGTWVPAKPREFRIRDPKPRVISAVPFADRVVHHAIIAVIEPILAQVSVPNSFACVKGGGTHAALRFLRGGLRRWPWFLKLDVRHHFETVDHGVLRAALRWRITDEPILAVLDRILDAGATSPGRGLPIGALTSQHFGNFLLSSIDRFALRTLRVPHWTRYMDDMIALGPDRDSVDSWRFALAERVRHQLRQEIKEEESLVAPVQAGVPFLGLRLWPTTARLDSARKRRLMTHHRRHRRALRAGEDSERVQTRAASVLAWAEKSATLGFRRALMDDPSLDR